MEALRERFGKYHVLEKIAQGGMAEVYKVKTVGIAGFEKVQALKRILPHSARQDRFIRSFIDEARIAVELTHRNIVQVFDFGKADGELFMAMELIEGRDLRTAMTQSVSRDALCPIPVAAYIIAEVAAGLDYAHRKTDGYGGALGIVHCDVSPSNVMLSTDGYVKILDFGIARATFSSALERRRLRGKPRYMAPEQTFGEPPTAAADVFALGIIAWELFTGLPLYRGHDVKAILDAVRRTEPPRIDRLNPDVPAEVVNAIATALSREPSQRGTASDVAAACSRTAMASGARPLAAWLAVLDKATEGSVSLQSASRSGGREPTESLASVPPPPPRPSTQSFNTPPLRPSTRSIQPIPPADFGEGTPGPAEFHERTATVSAIIEQHPRFLTEPTTTVNAPGFERATTTAPSYPQPFGERERTGSVTATKTASTTGAQKWGHEATAAGV
ncbi:MAG TPA: serine/threonine-protein kinase, partial [Kofleriaceae bacterium]|nr:serine/threonine-protein kinase [Kofleriaceae bacterium]